MERYFLAYFSNSVQNRRIPFDARSLFYIVLLFTRNNKLLLHTLHRIAKGFLTEALMDKKASCIFTRFKALFIWRMAAFTYTCTHTAMYCGVSVTDTPWQGSPQSGSSRPSTQYSETWGDGSEGGCRGGEGPGKYNTFSWLFNIYFLYISSSEILIGKNF